jgi:hypothetical protein
MRHFHVLKNRTFAKTVNVDKLWSLAGAEAYEKAKTAKGQAPLLDLTKLVRCGDLTLHTLEPCIFLTTSVAMATCHPSLISWMVLW